MTRSTTGQLSEIFPSFQGEGAYVGRRQLFLRLAGCSVGCRFCDTVSALRPGAEFEVRGPAGGVLRLPNPVPARRVAELVARQVAEHGPFHAVAVTGGEPLEQADFLADLLPRIALPVLLETAGTLPDALLQVIDHVAIVSMDLKLPSVTAVGPCFAEHRRFLGIARQRDVYVKAVVSERLDPADWEAALRLLVELAPAIPFYVQPVTDRDGRPRVPFALLQRLAARASAAGLADVRVLPQVHRFLEAP